MDLDSNISWIKLSLHLLLYLFVTNKIDCLDATLEAVSIMKNVALFKPTFQSSQLNNASSSDLAVDGNVTTCSATGKQKGANWTLDLIDVHPISHFKINTGGNGTYFGPNFELHVSTPQDGTVLCNYGTDKMQEEHVMSCFSGPVRVKMLTITNLYASGVTLCEVQVFVCEDGFFDMSCSKQCHCVDNAVCDKIDGKCPGLCAPGWNGKGCQTECDDKSFGPSCRHKCHCQNDLACDKQTGDCSNGCGNGWVGPGCRTEIPRLATPPTMFRVDTTSIDITWSSWLGFIDPSIRLLYQIEYKLSSDGHGNESSWTKGPLVNDSELYNEVATVTGLRRISFYSFRVIPIPRP